MKEFKKGDIVIINDGGRRRQGTVVENGVDSKNRVRVRPEGIPLDMSITLNPNDNVYIVQHEA